MPSERIRQVAILANSLPRQCGIATFSDDLATGLSNEYPDMNVDIVAMSDRDDYEYPDRVSWQIPESDYSAYRLGAEFINRFGYDVLSIQHEYGIFGGEAGSYLMNLAREVKMPIVTTLHTVLREPSEAQKVVMDELLQLSERIVVMSHKAVCLLTEVHNVPAEKIDLIPHGIPNMTEYSGQDLRKTLGIKGPMILTFGLLSPTKGIEYVIQAMPKILEKSPDAVYVVVGATHPHVRTFAGESYREKLVQLASDLNVSDNVRFVDRFVQLEELVEYLGAMDIYITPYLNEKQITSGTLAYAVGAGKAVISTPYWYAEELLGNERGILVPFRDSEAISEAVVGLQNNPELRKRIGKNAAEFGKKMLWPEVSRGYKATFERAKRDSTHRLRYLIQKPMMEESCRTGLPDLKLHHLFELSDDTGIFQHATFTTPNRKEGYCVDDNARALLFTAYLSGLQPLDSNLQLLQSRYLSFVMDAFNPDTGRFRNFMSFSRTWLEDSGSEDSQGRTLWGLATLLHYCRDNNRHEVAKRLFESAVDGLLETTSIRTWTYAVLACEEFLSVYPEQSKIQELMTVMVDRIVEQFEDQACDCWPWFEQKLTYANCRLPQAMLVAGKRLKNENYLQIGFKSLNWVMKVQSGKDGIFCPIGSNGFYANHENRSYFDQQPIEAWASVSACLVAFKLTGEVAWHKKALQVFQWFLGENQLGIPVYDAISGGCHDGLHPKRMNRNQGAESTLAFLCSLVELRLAKNSTQLSYATTMFNPTARAVAGIRK